MVWGSKARVQGLALSVVVYIYICTIYIWVECAGKIHESVVLKDFVPNPKLILSPVFQSLKPKAYDRRIHDDGPRQEVSASPGKSFTNIG